MMRILIKHSYQKVGKLQAEIEKMEKEVETMTPKDAIKKNYEILDKVMEEHQVYLRDKKRWKIKRDDMDYKEGRVYTFAHTHDNVRTSTLNRKTREDTMESDSASMSSVTSAESVSSNSGAPMTCTPQGSSSFSVEMERICLGTKLMQRGQRSEEVGSDGYKNKASEGQGVQTRSKKIS
ncbi:hypothetical protein NDU88_003660 [Pleurodeles waltl]|uniref:Uncharacterized protein n=1 Tax=Pleurodeles waltl TaxID=8319 RepID=A0AAV7V0M8_PLEWA|nr:hypothetical protein NDU88_003660 [Pleurodeles waltl]